MARVRKLSVDERMVYGRCRICDAAHGKPCFGDHKTPIGIKLDGTRLAYGEGAHQARIADAPKVVREEARR